MDSQIEEFLSNFTTSSTMYNALKFPNNCKSAKEFETREGLHMDFVRPINVTTLILIIYPFSNWIKMFHIKKSRTPFSVIELLGEIFVDIETPELIVSDNGPSFKSEQFKLCFSLFNNIYNSIKLLNYTIKTVSIDESIFDLMTKFSVITNLPKIQEAKSIKMIDNDKKFIEHVNIIPCLAEKLKHNVQNENNPTRKLCIEIFVLKL
jgi:hypothetical protein